MIYRRSQPRIRWRMNTPLSINLSWLPGVSDRIRNTRKERELIRKPCRTTNAHFCLSISVTAARRVLVDLRHLFALLSTRARLSCCRARNGTSDGWLVWNAAGYWSEQIVARERVSNASRGVLFSSVLFLSRPRSEGWPHHGCIFSIYLYPLSFWLTLLRGVLSQAWFHVKIKHWNILKFFKIISF